MTTPISGPRAASGVADYAASDSADSKSPLSGFPFLKNLASTTQKQTKDGQAPKRRGPKPDSKPALTRRQELNRQAQRTHRERKEMYIKALEQEVLRLKELYGSATRDRDNVDTENQKLKALLAAHGISYESISPVTGYQPMPSQSYSVTSSGSVSGSHRYDTTASSFSPPGLRTQDSTEMQGLTAHPQPGMGSGHVPNNNLNYDQIGIDFVLTLERPCMEHMQYLVVRSHNPEGKAFNHPMERSDDGAHEHMCGHALMASCPPASHIMNSPDEPYPHKMPDLKTPDLMRLLDLSSKLPLEGEITPVMAWMMILQSKRVFEMTAQDFELVKVDLAGKVRCYGFGAVLEEFEVRDALSSLFAAKEGFSMGQMAPVQAVEAY
ncbi:hypothetical protein AAFC00_002914 [Neodothiora populina]|uniref:BZIP domain-containing protein n=1 Tax=Neodothiora populina TaxID=2781224 RepID=A0ABR3P9E3_9PEZI